MFIIMSNVIDDRVFTLAHNPYLKIQISIYNDFPKIMEISTPSPSTNR